jgi:TetR/AcrR family transcriptional repressor of nem operon
MSRKPNLKARDHILEIALHLMFKDGFKGVSMDDVAKAAGMKKANLFHYYPTKEALGLAVFDYSVREMHDEMTARYASDDVDPAQMIGNMFDGASQGMQKSGCSGGCFVGNMAQELSDCNENLRHKVANHMHLWQQRLADYLERWRSKGYFKSDFDTGAGAQGIFSLFEGAMLVSKATRNTQALENSKQFALTYFQAFKS